MPNWVKNVLKFKGNEDQINEMIEKYSTDTENGVMFPDFNKVIEMPESLDVVDTTSPSEELKRQYLRNERDYGHSTWYGWRCEHWGTKWNVADCCVEPGGRYVFETAWSSVPKMIKNISKEYPEIEIDYRYADEDSSYNTGELVVKGGEIVKENYPDGGTTEGYELYFYTRPEDRKEYEFVDGTYKWKDEEF